MKLFQRRKEQNEEKIKEESNRNALWSKIKRSMQFYYSQFPDDEQFKKGTSSDENFIKVAVDFFELGAWLNSILGHEFTCNDTDVIMNLIGNANNFLYSLGSAYPGFEKLPYKSNITIVPNIDKFSDSHKKAGKQGNMDASCKTDKKAKLDVSEQNVESYDEPKKITKKPAKRKNNTRTKNSARVHRWQKNHPTGSKTECSKKLGLAYSTVRKYWKDGIESASS